MNTKQWMLTGICAIVIVAILYFSGFKSWPFLLILLCPLMHLFMMKGHKH